MNGMGLSAEALEMRRSRLHAGDAARVMAGQWNLAWRIKKGLEEDPDLYDEMPFYMRRNMTRKQMDMKRLMGLYTEPFNLAYCEMETGRPVEYFSGSPMMGAAWNALTGRIANMTELQVSRSIPFMACNLDGMSTTAQGHRCVLDAKHVGRSDDPMILRYTAAGTHQATVMETDYWALSVFVGNSKWEYIEQPVDPLYQAELIAKEREFWGFVERGEEPEDRGEPTLPPKPQPKLRTIILPTNEESDVFQAMCREENWLPGALPEIRAFIATEGPAKRYAIARKNLVEAIPETVGEFQWGRYRAKRSKANALTMTVEKLEGDDEPG